MGCDAFKRVCHTRWVNISLSFCLDELKTKERVYRQANFEVVLVAFVCNRLRLIMISLVAINDFIILFHLHHRRHRRRRRCELGPLCSLIRDYIGRVPIRPPCLATTMYRFRLLTMWHRPQNWQTVILTNKRK